MARRASPQASRTIASAVARALARPPPTAGPTQWLELRDLVAAWRVSGPTIIRVFVGQQGLPALRLGHGWRFRADDVKAWEARMFAARTEVSDGGGRTQA